MRFSNKYGFYELNPFPGCNQVVISNHAFIYQEHRGKGLGVLQHQQRLRKAKELGYDYIICTVKADNIKEIHILEMHGWSELSWFMNRETDNQVKFYGRRLVLSATEPEMVAWTTTPRPRASA